MRWSCINDAAAAVRTALPSRASTSSMSVLSACGVTASIHQLDHRIFYCLICFNFTKAAREFALCKLIFSCLGIFNVHGRKHRDTTPFVSSSDWLDPQFLVHHRPRKQNVGEPSSNPGPSLCKKRSMWGGGVTQLVEHRTGMLPTQVRFPGAATDFFPIVNFQGRLSHGVRTTPMCNRMHLHLCAR